MKGFWALPAVLRLALASHATFTVLDDILSFPQYQVGLSHSILSDSEAESKIAALSAQSSPTAAPPHAESTLDVQHFDPHDDASRRSREAASRKDETIRDYELMMLHNQRYLCSIPAVERTPESNATADVPSPEDVEKELVRAAHHGEELLRGMEGHCIFFNTGWWTYSFCYNQSVRQFHSLPPSRQVPLYPPVEDENVQSYVLGQFQAVDKGGENGGGKQKLDLDAHKVGKRQSAETGLARLEQEGKLKYLVQNLAGGTTCDLTGKERRIEVQFHCVPNSIDRIALIKELATCTYLMVIHTSRLCNDVAFQPPQRDKPNAIRCAPVIPDGADIGDFPSLAYAFGEKEQQQEQQAEPEPEHNLMDEDFPIVVGDIEFGGHRILPASPPVDLLATNEREVDSDSEAGWLRDRDSLANSLILGGPRETLLATVASSHAPTLSEEELRKLNLRDREINQIPAYKKEMESASKGKSWRLDIVETATGREFRGIIEADADVRNGGASGKGVEEKGGDEKNEKDEKGSGSGDGDDENEGSEEVFKEEL